jgi:16S rRNA (guanine966-N2)-methyltransferase
MRIIGGKFKGRTIRTPKDLPVRPTTDFAKEGLFNILSNQVEFEDLKVLDLFSGTGHISLEFLSRGSNNVVAVDQNFKCVGFLRSVAKELALEGLTTVKSDVFAFLENSSAKSDLIFADPPYDLERIPDIHRMIFERKLLSEGGLLVIEHGPRTSLVSLTGFVQHRKYGNVNFSFFRQE